MTFYEFPLNIGFELEAGFTSKLGKSLSLEKKKFFKLIKDLKYKYGGDGSIHTGLNSYPLEIKSKVYKIKIKKDLKKIFEDFEKIIEFIEEINQTCGIHIHISFDNMKDYFSILNYDFADNFVNEYKKKFTSVIEQARLTNNFCKRYTTEYNFKNATRNQLKANYRSHRYFAVNYNSFNILKTIEFRIFPTTKNLNKFKDYFNFLYDYVIKYLKENYDGFEKKELIKKVRKKDSITKEEEKPVILGIEEIEEIEETENKTNFLKNSGMNPYNDYYSVTPTRNDEYDDDEEREEEREEEIEEIPMGEEIANDYFTRLSNTRAEQNNDEGEF